MKTITVNHEGVTLEATYEIMDGLFVDLNVVAPFKFRVLSRFLVTQAKITHYGPEVHDAVKKYLFQLCAQCRNVLRYEQIYRDAYTAYETKLKTLFETSNKMDFENVRGAKFQYEISHQHHFLEEFGDYLAAKIPEFNDENYKEFLIETSILKQIFHATEI